MRKFLIAVVLVFLTGLAAHAQTPAGGYISPICGPSSGASPSGAYISALCLPGFSGIANNIWTPKGQLANLTAKSNPNVIYEGNAKILSGNVFKMWCNPNNNGGGLYYYESLDGVTSWTAHPSNPIVAADTLVTVYKVASTYYLYGGSGGGIFVRTSADGITWSASTVIINVGTAGQWDVTNVFQLNLVPGTPGFGTNTGETYYAYYEGIGAGGSAEGLVTATSLTGPWTKSGSNPIFTVTSPGSFQAINGTYYFWAPHGAVSSGLSSQNLGYNSLERWSATNPAGPWTELTFGGQGVGIIYPSIQADFDLAGTNTNTQGANVSDPYIVSALGNMYVYWTRTTVGGIQSGVNAAVATGVTPAQQVSGFEGMAGFPIPNSNLTPIGLQTLGSDNFQRANANPIGGNWSHLLVGTDNQIASNLCESATAPGNGISYYNTPFFPADQWSKITIQTLVSGVLAGAFVRMSTALANTDYQANFTGPLGSASNLKLSKTVVGTATTLGNMTTLKVSSGDTVMLVVSGTNLLVYYDGFPVLAATDASIATGAPGLWNNASTLVTDSQISAWSGGSFTH